jgi:hypothetical protein
MIQEDPAATPSFKQHFYPDVNVSWRVAGHPDKVFRPGCCGRGSHAGSARLAPGQAWDREGAGGKVVYVDGDVGEDASVISGPLIQRKATVSTAVDSTETSTGLSERARLNQPRSSTGLIQSPSVNPAESIGSVSTRLTI